MKRRYQVGVVVNDAEPHSTSSFSAALTRAQLRDLANAGRLGIPHVHLTPARRARAQQAVRTIDALLEQAELARNQRLAGLPPKARHRGRA